MLNRIRRAVALARARHVPQGRHRRPTTLARPAPVTPSTPVAAPSPPAVDRPHPHPLHGEENALVRPYMLVGQVPVRRRSVVVAPRLPAETWSALAEVR
ncbi:hypothetical protein [Streptomyces olivaceus]|uniref:hypothetical protein n=1 Tax=Streptomyces olivaceus TaxID=47716 RepID=UPI0036A75EBF